MALALKNNDACALNPSVGYGRAATVRLGYSRDAVRGTARRARDTISCISHVQRWLLDGCYGSRRLH